MVKNQKITDRYSIYNGDSMELMKTLPDESVDLSMYSPPFVGLYKYSSSQLDLSNCKDKEEFLKQYEFFVKEKFRIMKSGRIAAVHAMDIFNPAGNNYHFPADLIKLHQDNGFDYKATITVWKEPLKIIMRTMVANLMHKFIVEDSTKSFTSIPDYVLVFQKRGENKVPVTHPFGLTHYAGEYPLLIEHLEDYGMSMSELKGIWKEAKSRYSYTDAIQEYINQSFEKLREKYKTHKDPRSNKLSHIIWQRYASSVWDDIRIDNVLKYKPAKTDDDEKHVHPLQLDVCDRLVELYSNPNEVVFTPFMGVGSEVYSAVSMGRFGIGCELKDSYYHQAELNLENVETRFEVKEKETSLF